jgi:beta-mannosidase
VSATFDGHVYREGEIVAAVPPLSSSQVGTIGARVLVSGDPRSSLLWLWGDEGRIPDNRTFFAEMKDLVRDRPSVSAEWIDNAEGLALRLTSDRHAYFTHVLASIDGVRYSDNWFDLFPGREKVIRIWHPNGTRLEPSDFELGWR